MKGEVRHDGWEKTPRGARARIRKGEWTGPTAGLAPGYVQANLVILPEDVADDFEQFCRANPQSLPLLDVTEPGSAAPRRTAPEADLRLDLPRYRVYREGRVDEEPTDIMTLWHADSVAFLIGCSFTFDGLLQARGVPVRHVDLGRNVPMYVTDRNTVPVGRFAGPLVVSMRPIPRKDVDRVANITRSLPDAHGEPIHVGSPGALGIDDLERPEYGESVPIGPDELPVFWACGVTAQAVARQARIERMITHAPGHMFITDIPVRRYRNSDGEITGSSVHL